MPSGPRGRDALAADPSVRIDRIIGVPGISRAAACLSWRPVWLVGRAIASRWGWMQLGKSLGIPHAASWRSGVRQRWPAHHGPWRWRAGRAWQSVRSVRPSARVLASIARVRAQGAGQEPGERHEVRNDEKRVEHRSRRQPTLPQSSARAGSSHVAGSGASAPAPRRTTATTTVPSPPPEHSRRTTSRLRRTISSANPDVPGHGCGVAGNRERLRAGLSQLFSADARHRRFGLWPCRGLQKTATTSIALGASEQEHTRPWLPGRHRPQALALRPTRRRAASVECFSFDVANRRSGRPLSLGTICTTLGNPARRPWRDCWKSSRPAASLRSGLTSAYSVPAFAGHVNLG